MRSSSSPSRSRSDVVVFFECRGDLEMRYAESIALEEEAIRGRDLDLEHAQNPDREMLEARASVDPYAPELALEIQRPQYVDAAVWEALYA